MTTAFAMPRSGVVVVVLRLGSRVLSPSLTDQLRELRERLPGTTVLIAENPDGNAPSATREQAVDHVIRFDANLGYACAVNRAVAAVRPEPRTIVVITNDVNIQRGSLTDLVEALGKTTAGISAPMNETDGQLRCGGSWSRRWGWARHRVVESEFSSDQPIDVDWADGACLAIDGELFQTLDGFDGRTFLYGEDLLFCLRTRQQNRRVIVVPAVRIVQESGMRRRSGAHGYLIARNELLAMRQTSTAWRGALVVGAGRTVLEFTRVFAHPRAWRHHSRQTFGMSYGLLDALRNRYGPPPKRLAAWAQIPCIQRGSPTTEHREAIGRIDTSAGGLDDSC